MELEPCPDCAREWGVCDDVTNRFEIREARFCGTCGRPINGYLPPNPPLTLDELRQMDGEPVWIELAGEGLIPTKAWGIVNAELELASGNSFNYCCADCGYKKACQRPCKNSPEKCGLVRQQVTKRKG